MKTCNGCVNEYLKNMAWSSTQPHPCTDCSRIYTEPTDKYQPKPQASPQIKRLSECCNEGVEETFIGWRCVLCHEPCKIKTNKPQMMSERKDNDQSK